MPLRSPLESLTDPELSKDASSADSTTTTATVRQVGPAYIRGAKL